MTTARPMGWDGLKNGALVAAAESGDFEVLVTIDKNLRYRQSLVGRRLAIITLDALFATLPGLTPLLPKLLDTLGDIEPGAFIVIGPKG